MSASAELEVALGRSDELRRLAAKASLEAPLDAVQAAYALGLQDGGSSAPGLRERVRELAAEWEREAASERADRDRLGDVHAVHLAHMAQSVLDRTASRLRALLADTPAPESVPVEPVAAAADQRAAFEAWAAARGLGMDLEGPGEVAGAVQLAWEAWQAALAASRPEDAGGKT